MIQDKTALKIRKTVTGSATPRETARELIDRIESDGTKLTEEYVKSALQIASFEELPERTSEKLNDEERGIVAHNVPGAEVKNVIDKEARKAAIVELVRNGMSYSAAAIHSGVSAQTISKWCAGAGVKTAYKIPDSFRHIQKKQEEKEEPASAARPLTPDEAQHLLAFLDRNLLPTIRWDIDFAFLS